MRHAIAKVTDAGNPRVLVTERGVSFGYNNLVVDMRALPMMRALGYPVVFDVTHSLQLPGAGDGVTAGQAEYIEPLASAASPPASTACSWKSTRSRRARRATRRTRCGSTARAAAAAGWCASTPIVQRGARA